MCGTVAAHGMSIGAVPSAGGDTGATLGVTTLSEVPTTNKSRVGRSEELQDFKRIGSPSHREGGLGAT
jgi:hypothetical protein